MISGGRVLEGFINTACWYVGYISTPLHPHGCCELPQCMGGDDGAT